MLVFPLSQPSPSSQGGSSAVHVHEARMIGATCTLLLRDLVCISTLSKLLESQDKTFVPGGLAQWAGAVAVALAAVEICPLETMRAWSSLMITLMLRLPSPSDRVVLNAGLDVLKTALAQRLKKTPARSNP